MDVLRLDFGRFSKVERTPQGGLRIPANLTRTGVFIYRKPDGTERRELRSDAEVFHPDSLATLRSAPVTNLHPERPVGPGNWAKLSVGHVGDDVKQDGKFVAAALMIQDEAAINDIERGDRKELSCGYTCTLLDRSGTHKGERYDAVQTNIRYNHVAIGPNGWGRAGNEVSLRLDADDAIQIPADPPPKLKPEDSMKTIRIDGVDYEAGSPQHLQAEQRRFDRITAENAKLEGERDGLQGKHDAIEGERDELKTKLDAAEKPERLDSLVAARVKLHTEARQVLGAEAKLDGKTDREVMIEVIKHDAKEFDATDRSDDYIRGRFDTATVSHKRIDQGGNGIGAARSAAVGTRKDAGDDKDKKVDRYDARAAQKRMHEANAQAATKPLRFTRSN